MKRSVVHGALVGVLLLVSSTANAVPISIAFNTTTDNLAGPPNDNPVGEPSNNVGLQLPGQVGPWVDLIVGSGRIGEVNGMVVNIFTDILTVMTGGLTFTFNTGGQRYETFNDPNGNDDLRQAVAFVRSGGRTDLVLSWSITGLDNNMLYDLIFFGQEGGVNPAQFAISGFDAGNGVGNAVTTDSEADGNFVGVSPAGGQIAGTFGLAGTGFASWSGLQIEATASIPEPSTLALFVLGLGILFVGAGRRRWALR